MVINRNEITEWAAGVEQQRRLPLALIQLTQVLYSAFSPHSVSGSNDTLLLTAAALIVTERRRMEAALDIVEPDGTDKITNASLLHAIDFVVGSMTWEDDNVFKAAKLRAAEANLRTIL